MPAPVRVTNVKEEPFACQREALILSRRRLLFQQFGGVIHHSYCHRTAAPLATCPPDQLSVPVSRPGHGPACLFAKTPCQPLPISGQSLVFPGSAAPDCPMCCVSGSFVIFFCLQRQELGKGDLGTGDSETGEEREWQGGEQRPTAGLRPGRDSAVSWTWQAQRINLVVVVGALFPEAKICSSSKLS